MQLCLCYDRNSTFHDRRIYHSFVTFIIFFFAHFFLPYFWLWTAFRVCARARIWNTQFITSKYCRGEQKRCCSRCNELRARAAPQWLSELATVDGYSLRMHFIIELLWSLQNENVFRAFLRAFWSCSGIVWHAFFEFRAAILIVFCCRDCGRAFEFVFCFPRKNAGPLVTLGGREPHTFQYYRWQKSTADEMFTIIQRSTFESHITANHLIEDEKVQNCEANELSGIKFLRTFYTISDHLTLTQSVFSSRIMSPHTHNRCTVAIATKKLSRIVNRRILAVGISQPGVYLFASRGSAAVAAAFATF